MSTEHDPIPPELEGLVRGMRADRLAPSEIAELTRRLGPLLEGGGGGGGGAPPVPTLLRNVGIGALAAGGAVLAIWVGIGTGSPDAPQPRSDASPLASVATEPQPAAPIDVELDDPAPTADVVHPAPTREPEPAETDRTVRGARAPATSEHVLLIDARRALDASPTRALALADRHAREFPDGALAPEREMIAVDALIALGRDAAARRRADRLTARWPSSVYAERARARSVD